jgi:hypothetical protein
MIYNIVFILLCGTAINYISLSSRTRVQRCSFLVQTSHSNLYRYSRSGLHHLYSVRVGEFRNEERTRHVVCHTLLLKGM